MHVFFPITRSGKKHRSLFIYFCNFIRFHMSTFHTVCEGLGQEEQNKEWKWFRVSLLVTPSLVVLWHVGKGYNEVFNPFDQSEHVMWILVLFALSFPRWSTLALYWFFIMLNPTIDSCHVESLGPYRSSLGLGSGIFSWMQHILWTSLGKKKLREHRGMMKLWTRVTRHQSAPPWGIKKRNTGTVCVEVKMG